MSQGLSTWNNSTSKSLPKGKAPSNLGKSGLEPITNKINEIKQTANESAKDSSIQEALEAFATSIGDSLISVSETNARAAAAQWKAQEKMMDKQMEFNANEAEKARNFSQGQFDASMSFNQQQAALANDFTKNMWNQTAEYNVAAAREAREWSAEQAQIQRAWVERMDNTAVQRRMADLEKAGINPILASGYAAGTGSGATGTTSTPSMNSASGASASISSGAAPSASGGLGSAGMENTSNQLATFGAFVTAISSAAEAAGKLATSKGGKKLVSNLGKIFH